MPIKDTIGWDVLALLMIEDMIKAEMKEHLFEEMDELFKGMAVNGQGIGIDFEEIRKAENMYD